MSEAVSTRCKNMIIGALVADAAAMGLHWIYDQPHIRKIAPDQPEFRHPDAQEYEGVMAFFAHGNRAAGDQSQYGEQVMVLLRALVRTGGQYDAAQYADEFRNHFGYGGAYVGYIDHATRDTLDNFRRYEDAAHAIADQVPFEGENRIRKAIIAKVLHLIAHTAPSALQSAFDESIEGISKDQNAISFGRDLLSKFRDHRRPTGAYDLQLPAIAKLPALIALLASQGLIESKDFETPVDSAIQTTSDHPVAAEFGMLSAQMMCSAATTGTIDAALMARGNASPQAIALIDEALSMQNTDNATVTKHFGMACDLPFGVPSAVHAMATSTSFSQAVRMNIYGGGDTCGRAILVGAVMGAVHGIGGKNGIPESWIETLNVKDDAMKLIETLLG